MILKYEAGHAYTPDFQLDLEKIESAIDENTRIIWICSPNNPTGNTLWSLQPWK